MCEAPLTAFDRLCSMGLSGGDQASVLPSFRDPPVVETVLGVQFFPFAELSVGHMGRFWAALPDWPKCRETEAIGQANEPFGDDALWSPRRLRLMTRPEVRLQIHNAKNDRLLQLENGWFTLNWRKGQGSAAYPRYGTLKSEFDALWSQYADFLISAGLESPVPSLWEVTYVNHVPKGALWSTPDQWSRVVPGLSAQVPSISGCRPESANGVWIFELGEQQGRLRVWIEHAKGGESEELLVLKLSSRGPVQGTDSRSLQNGFELGRSSVVRMFTAVTSEVAHEHWGREA